MLSFETGTIVLVAITLFAAFAALRRPIRSERRFGVPFVAGLGFLYSITTISGSAPGGWSSRIFGRASG